MPFQMKTFDNWREVLFNSFANAFGQIVSWMPNVLAMLAIMAVGYFVARFALKLAEIAATKIGLQGAVDRSGLGESMKKAGIHRSAPQIVGQVVFWLLICVFLTAAFNALDLKAVSDATAELVKFIPKVLVAMGIVVIGLLVASFLRGVIATGADRVGLSYAEHLASGCYYLLALMTFLGAFEQLGMHFSMLKELVLIAFGAAAFGFSLAFGLGGRDVMGGILAGYYTRQRMQPGDKVQVCGMEGTVREVGPVATVIETVDAGLVSRHTVPNTKMLTEAVR